MSGEFVIRFGNPAELPRRMRGACVLSLRPGTAISAQLHTARLPDEPSGVT
jgi:hypothetical protein